MTDRVTRRIRYLLGLRHIGGCGYIGTLAELLHYDCRKAGIVTTTWWYRLRCKSMGGNVMIDRSAELVHPAHIRIGNHVTINKRCFVGGLEDIYIGDNTHLGQEVVILSSQHKFDRLDIPIWEQGVSKKPVYIAEDVWIGVRAIILPGVHIGKGAVIAAGAVVTHDVPEYGVAMGVPCSLRRFRNRYNKTETLCIEDCS